MKTVKKRKTLRKHLYLGYTLIFFGTLTLLIAIIFIAKSVIPQSTKFAVLGAFTFEGKQLAVYIRPTGGGNSSTKTYDTTNTITTSNSNSYGPIGFQSFMPTGTQSNPKSNSTYSPSSKHTTNKTPTEQNQPPTPTPTIPPTDDSTAQQIIDIIDNQFSPTPTPSPAPAKNTHPTPTGPQPTQHEAPPEDNSSPSTTNNNTSEIDVTYQQNNSSSTLLPSDSLSTTQQKLNTILENQGIHVTIQNVNNKTIITAINSEGKTVQFTSDLVDKLTDLLLQDAWPKIIKINDANFLIKKGNAVAQTHFPLGFDPVNNTPTVTFGTDEQQITFLPDQAAAHITQTGLIDSLGSSSFFKYIFPTYTPPPADVTMQLAALNDTPVYAITGTVKKKLFNFIPIPVKRTVYLSAANGVTVQMTEDPISSLLDKLSQ